MSKWLIIVLLLFAANAQCEENTMVFQTTGIVFSCANEATDPWGTCFMVQGNRWGQKTPGYDPAPGDTVWVKFTFKRILKPGREHEDMFYVSDMKVLYGEYHVK